MKIRTLAAALCVLLASACSKDATGPSATYESIAGTYTGNTAGLSQGVALVGRLSLTVSQTNGSLSGTWAHSGSLTNGWDTATINGTGTLGGTVGSGTNPSVNITIRLPSCPGYSANFSGTLDSANRRITLNGPIHILDDCEIWLTYPTTYVITL